MRVVLFFVFINFVLFCIFLCSWNFFFFFWIFLLLLLFCLFYFFCWFFFFFFFFFFWGGGGGEVVLFLLPFALLAVFRKINLLWFLDIQELGGPSCSFKAICGCLESPLFYLGTRYTFAVHFVFNVFFD